MIEVPDFLCHYYNAVDGPLRNLSDLPMDMAEALLDRLRREGDRFASQRSPDYLSIRRELEDRVRTLFIEKGGRPKRLRPQYFILGACPWLESWYPQGCVLRIPLAAIPFQSVSFTYGDTFPAMRYRDGKPYRRQVFTLQELPALVSAYGLPQVWNADGHLGPDRYIEAQVWDDGPLKPYIVNHGGD
jgi:hypothetical protein